MRSPYKLGFREKQLGYPRNHQLGVAAVEFVITLPVLLFLLFVAAEMGRLLYQYNTLTKSVEDGARFLATNVRVGISTGTLDTTIIDAENLVRYGTTTVSTPLLPGLDTATVSILTDEPPPNRIVVTATYTYDPMIFPDTVVIPLWQGVQLAVPLTATVSMPRL